MRGGLGSKTVVALIGRIAPVAHERIAKCRGTARGLVLGASPPSPRRMNLSSTERSLRNESFFCSSANLIKPNGSELVLASWPVGGTSIALPTTPARERGELKWIVAAVGIKFSVQLAERASPRGA